VEGEDLSCEGLAFLKRTLIDLRRVFRKLSVQTHHTDIGPTIRDGLLP
jgi:hypothetical protein